MKIRPYDRFQSNVLLEMLGDKYRSRHCRELILLALRELRNHEQAEQAENEHLLSAGDVPEAGP